MTKDLYIGLLSGTSLDAIDLALCEINKNNFRVIKTFSYPVNKVTKEHCLKYTQSENVNLIDFYSLDTKLGKLFADAVNSFLFLEKINPKDIIAIGSHGQTIKHYPNLEHPFTVQFGDPNIIAKKTNITTVSDFRRGDLALNGQGAPLIPLFHKYLFKTEKEDRVILNLGGIANISFLPSDSTKEIIGFDTGPANTFLDLWINECKQKNYDNKGEFARSGKIIRELLNNLLKEPYYYQPYPKSTGREYFSFSYLKKHLKKKYSNNDIQATLVELTAITSVNEINNLLENGTLIICGGGIYNSFLLERINFHLNNKIKMCSSNEFGVLPDWIEASLFAWLAYNRINEIKLDYKKVTGSIKSSVLGAVYLN